jgi:hypothetical protein
MAAASGIDGTLISAKAGRTATAASVSSALLPAFAPGPQ